MRPSYSHCHGIAYRAAAVTPAAFPAAMGATA